MRIKSLNCTSGRKEEICVCDRISAHVLFKRITLRPTLLSLHIQTMVSKAFLNRSKEEGHKQFQ